MASAELLKIAHSVEGKVTGVDERVKSVDERVKNVSSDVQGVDKKVQGVSEKVQGVDDKLEQVNRSSFSNLFVHHSESSDVFTGTQLRDSLLRWLSPPDPSINHNVARKVHHDGTSQWFFQGSIFKEWKFAGSFLWIHGKRAFLLPFTIQQFLTSLNTVAGSGKSILRFVGPGPSFTRSSKRSRLISSSSSIIQDILALHDPGMVSIAYFYFDFRDVDKQKLQNLLSSLLIQLSARSDPCCDRLYQLYSAHDRGVRKPSDRAMVECLKEMLTVETHGHTYVIIDALDECPITSSIPSPREEVLEFLNELVDLHLHNLHICATSRPELDIRAILEPLTLHPVSLHDEIGQKQDIADYISSFVHSDRRMRRWRDEDKDLVIKMLSEKADGM